jgi:PAS domain S-box-containing protein
MVTEDDAGDPVIVYVSDGFSDLTGFPSEEVITLSPGSVLLDTGDEEGSETLRAALTSDSSSLTELKAISKSGTKFNLHVISVPLQDGAGETAYHISIFVDPVGPHQSLSDSGKSISMPPTTERVRRFFLFLHHPPFAAALLMPLTSRFLLLRAVNQPLPSPAR